MALIIGSGKGGGGTRAAFVADDLFFASAGARDAFFTANPSRLKDKMYVVTANKLQQYQEPAWVDVTAIIRGENGKSAYEEWIDDGNSGTVQDFLDWMHGEDGKSLKILANGNLAWWDDTIPDWVDSGIPAGDAAVAVHNVSPTAHADIRARLDSLENLGDFAGAFNTFALIPANKSAFTQGISVNDFVNVRADETHSGAVTQYVCTGIAGDGTLTWAFNMELSADVSGKLDKVKTVTTLDQAYVKKADGSQGMVDVSPAPVAGDIPVYGAGGVLKAAAPVAAGDVANKDYTDALVIGYLMTTSQAMTHTGAPPTTTTFTNALMSRDAREDDYIESAWTNTTTNERYTAVYALGAPGATTTGGTLFKFTAMGDGKVKTVNGVEPDNAGDVVVKIYITQAQLDYLNNNTSEIEPGAWYIVTDPPIPTPQTQPVVSKIMADGSDFNQLIEQGTYRGTNMASWLTMLHRPDAAYNTTLGYWFNCQVSLTSEGIIVQRVEMVRPDDPNVIYERASQDATGAVWDSWDIGVMRPYFETRMLKVRDSRTTPPVPQNESLADVTVGQRVDSIDFVGGYNLQSTGASVLADFRVTGVTTGKEIIVRMTTASAQQGIHQIIINAANIATKTVAISPVGNVNTNWSGQTVFTVFEMIGEEFATVTRNDYAGRTDLVSTTTQVEFLAAGQQLEGIADIDKAVIHDLTIPVGAKAFVPTKPDWDNSNFPASTAYADFGDPRGVTYDEAERKLAIQIGHWDNPDRDLEVILPEEIIDISFADFQLLTPQDKKGKCFSVYDDPMDKTDNTMLRFMPEKWVVGTEYDFGGGVYGQRFTGNIVAAANIYDNRILIGTGISEIIDLKKCWWQRGSDAVKAGVRGSMYVTGIINSASDVIISGGALVLFTYSGSARSGTTNNAFDLCVIYTKI